MIGISINIIYHRGRAFVVVGQVVRTPERSVMTVIVLEEGNMRI